MKLLPLLLAACCIPLGPSDEPGSEAQEPSTRRSRESLPPLPAAPASLGDPDRSAAARPPWATSTDYAPQAPPQVLELGRPAAGPLREGLLACTLRSNHVENHIRRRNNVPDLDVQLAWGGHTVFVRGSNNTAEVFISAPLVSLMYEGIGSDGNDTNSPLRHEDIAAFMAMVDDPGQWKPPFLLRARTGGRWLFQQAQARGG